MNNILETIIMLPLICIIIILHSRTASDYLNTLPFFNGKINELIQFYEFICENNPLLLDYIDKRDENKKEEEKEKMFEKFLFFS